MTVTATRAWRRVEPMNDAPARRRRWPRLLAFALALCAVPAVVLGVQVDDWTRDLHVNVAETAPDAPDARLRPLVVSTSPEAARTAIARVALSFPGWARVADDGERLHFERTSALFGFVDDVWVWLEPQPSGELWIQAKGQSRVGKGDLGQNPRTLDALLRGLERELPDARRVD
ncbi:MAG: DUF1499 domain-containing protein [Planctomycetota bacterium]